jgi:hypothetical protein
VRTLALNNGIQRTARRAAADAERYPTQTVLKALIQPQIVPNLAGGDTIPGRLPNLVHQATSEIKRPMRVAKPNRVTRTFTQQLVAEPSKVLPLLCPVREADWIDGWEPLAVFSESGVAEPDCVFLTEASPSNAIWYITRHEPSNGFLEMIKISPNVTACRLSIQLRPVETGSEATITYAHTSLGPDGDTFIRSFTEEYYQQFMRDWEARMNHYLFHGSSLRAADG